MLAERREVLHGTEGDELAGEIADGGAFEVERQHRQPGGVGGGLTKQPVLRQAQPIILPSRLREKK